MYNIINRSLDITTEQEAVIEEVMATYNLLFPIAYIASRACNYNLNEVKKFLTLDCKPYTYKGLPDIDKAVDIILKHLELGSKIRIVGDYDCDGITATTLLLIFFKSFSANVSYYIPNREKDGYGLNQSIVERCQIDGVNLIITVDNGISANESISYAKSCGIDVIITDHHIPQDTLPTADAIVNPMLYTSTYPNRDLAGVGVAYKLVQALSVAMKQAPNKAMIDKMYTLVTLGTICDVMDLKGENRALIRKGFVAQNEGNAFPQLKVFATNANVGTVGFQIGPRLNACGRLSTANIAVEYLLGTNLSEADTINDLNKRRQELEKEATNKLLSRITEIPNIIIETVEDLDEGVTGLVANNIKDTFYRPAIIFVKTRNGYKASGRSIDEYNLFEGVSKNLHLLKSGGGHAMACGLCADSLEQIENFKQAMLQDTQNFIFPTAEEIKNTIKVDYEIENCISDFNTLSNQLKLLAPFGKGNPSPLFLLKNTYISLKTKIAKGYIITDTSIKDSTGHSLLTTIWGDESLPTEFQGRADVILGVENDALIIKRILKLIED